MATYREQDATGRIWTIVRNPAGWVAYDERDPYTVLDPYRTLRETRAAVRSIKAPTTEEE